jgi:hypothetical protein
MSRTVELVLEKRRYPVCPECGKHTIVAFTPPIETGVARYFERAIDWDRAHLYCCNGETNCSFNTRILDLTTPLKEPK